MSVCTTWQEPHYQQECTMTMHAMTRKRLSFSCSSSITILIMHVCVVCPTNHSRARFERWLEERRHFPLERLCSIIIASQLWEGSLTVCWLSWKRLPVIDTGTSWQSQLDQGGIGGPSPCQTDFLRASQTGALTPTGQIYLPRDLFNYNQVYGNLAFIKNSIHTM